MAFKEWVEDATFYDRLTDGETSAVETFRRYKHLIELETPSIEVNGNQ